MFSVSCFKISTCLNDIEFGEVITFKLCIFLAWCYCDSVLRCRL